MPTLSFVKLLDPFETEREVKEFELNAETECSKLFKSIFWVERMGVILLESELTNELGSLKLLSCKGKNEYAWLSEEFNFSKAFCIKESKSSVSCMSKNESILNLHSLLLEDTFPLFHIPLHLLVSQKQIEVC